jgi:hypothetical protein
MEYIRKWYGVPAKRGSRVIYKGMPAVIVASHGPYLRLRIEGMKRIATVHPDDIDYSPIRDAEQRDEAVAPKQSGDVL